MCNLALNPVLRAIVEEKLRRRWSPQQIAGWLKGQLPRGPGDAGVAREHLPHPFFVQARGALNKELTAYLRTGRVIRRPRESDCLMAVAGDRTPCTSPNDRPRPRTVRCQATGKATWSSAEG